MLQNNDMNYFLNTLIAGDQLTDDAVGAVRQSSLKEIINVVEAVSAETPLINHSLSDKSSGVKLRILTGDESDTDQEIFRVVNELELPLHIVSSGTRDEKKPSVQYAERYLSLGENNELQNNSLANDIRAEVALAFSDLVVILWSGKPNQEQATSVEYLLRQSILARKPVVWLQEDGSTNFLDVGQLDDAFLHHLRGQHYEVEWLKEFFFPVAKEELRAELYRLIGRVLNPSLEEQRSHEIEKLTNYLSADKEPGWLQATAGQAHRLLSAITRLDIVGIVESLKISKVSPYFGLIQPESSHPIKTPKILLDRFAQSDVSATIAAGRHRDMSWLLYIFSALAVFAAVAGAIHLWPSGHGAFWPICELLLVSAIVLAVWLSKKKNWHEMWVGHRFMAEQFRYACMGLPLLAVPPTFLEPLWHVNPDAKQSVRLRSAELWLLQRTLASEGIPQGNGGSYSPASRDNVLILIKYVQEIIADQISFHKKNGHNLHRCHENMHKLSVWLFVLTFVAVIAHFVLHSGWLLIFTGFFPALAAALHGIMTKQEMTRLSSQSEKTVENLTHLSKALHRVETTCDSKRSDELFWMHARHLTLEAATVLSDENSQWQLLMEHQETELPA